MADGGSSAGLRTGVEPGEALWAWTKQGDFANTAIDGLGEVADRVRSSTRRCRRRNALLLGLLAKAGLPIPI